MIPFKLKINLNVFVIFEKVNHKGKCKIPVFKCLLNNLRKSQVALDSNECLIEHFLHLDKGIF